MELSREIENIEQDIQELNLLLSQATRDHTKQLLSNEIK